MFRADDHAQPASCISARRSRPDRCAYLVSESAAVGANASYDLLERALSIPNSKDGIAQLKRSHRAFEPTHTWAVISASASLSSVPRRIRMWSGSVATRANTGDPQREQKHRRTPGEDSYSEIRSSPAMIRYRSSGIRALAENAVPLARRQRSQWQSRTSPMGPTISNWKPPQRHAPRISFG